MDRRRISLAFARSGVVRLVAASFALASCAVVACSGSSDDDALGGLATADEDGGGNGTDDASRGRRPGAPGAQDGGESPGDASPLPLPTDAAGAADVFDAGVCPDPGSPSLAPALQGAPDYVATFGPSSRSTSHGANPNPSGRACLNCHNPGGTGRPFFFGGTVKPQPLAYVALDAGPDAGDAGTVRVDAGVFPVQVLVREGQGRVLSVYTDQDGNYFLEASNAPSCAVYPVRGAIRRGTATKVMPNQQSTGNCLGCHGSAVISLVAP